MFLATMLLSGFYRCCFLLKRPGGILNIYLHPRPSLDRFAVSLTNVTSVIQQLDRSPISVQHRCVINFYTFKILRTIVASRIIKVTTHLSNQQILSPTSALSATSSTSIQQELEEGFLASTQSIKATAYLTTQRNSAISQSISYQSTTPKLQACSPHVLRINQLPRRPSPNGSSHHHLRPNGTAPTSRPLPRHDRQRKESHRIPQTPPLPRLQKRSPQTLLPLQPPGLRPRKGTSTSAALTRQIAQISRELHRPRQQRKPAQKEEIHVQRQHLDQRRRAAKRPNHLHPGTLFQLLDAQG